MVEVLTITERRLKRQGSVVPDLLYSGGKQCSFFERSRSMIWKPDDRR